MNSLVLALALFFGSATAFAPNAWTSRTAGLQRTRVAARAQMDMKTLLVYSTTTGNTEVCAGYISEATGIPMVRRPAPPHRRHNPRPRLRHVRDADPPLRSTSETPRTRTSLALTASSAALLPGTRAPTSSAVAPSGTASSTTAFRALTFRCVALSRKIRKGFGIRP